MIETSTNDRMTGMPLTIVDRGLDKPQIKYAPKDGIRKQYTDALAQLEQQITSTRINWLANRGSDSEASLKAELDRVTAKFNVVEANLVALDA